MSTSFAQLSETISYLATYDLRSAFEADPKRFAAFTATFEDMTIDFSKELIDQEAWTTLIEFAQSSALSTQREKLFSGDPINLTENRAVMHMALRASAQDGCKVDGEPVFDQVNDVREALLSFADQIRSGEITSATGQKFTDVINIGIGGSDLGPVMVERALSPYRGDGPKLHFVSNVDGAHLSDVTAGLNPATTLVIVVSKTFTTQETLANAAAARAWLETAMDADKAGQNMAAVSTNLEGTSAFGIADDHVFGFWDWVGGRYSVWSAVGLSVAIAVGSEHFRAFLAGARAMDQHFLNAEFDKNLPVILALIGILRRNVLDMPTVALIPYEQRLERFSAYVQQLDMESNGKSITRGGNKVSQATAPIIWGEPGTNSQHSFFQLIHQGTDVIPIDFIISAEPRSALADQHDMLIANCLAQSEALAFGKTEDEVAEDMRAKGATEDEIERLKTHRSFSGNRPSTTIVQKTLDPYALGRLIALYEHKVFVQGVLWDVNSYDQWGVELGKALANQLLPMVKGDASPADKDGSTQGLLAAINKLKA